MIVGEAQSGYDRAETTMSVATYAPQMAMDSSAESPVALRTIARAVSDWVGRLGRVWVEGQITQISRRPGQATAFLTLRDTVADVSMQVTAQRTVLEVLGPALVEGARVVCWVQPEVYLGRGSLQLTAYEIRPVGIGALLARLEALKRVLAAEGLFAADRKQALPFLPRRVGLITGRASAASRDVVENARRRWPAVTFAIREVAVQGPNAVTGVIEALHELDRLAEVDVVVLARGGGSLEDLLPFSDEALCRAVADCRTPVVSAIGHEQDSPLVDFVADVRASTPTDAGKRVVPDVDEERARIQRARSAASRCITSRIGNERAGLLALRARPALAAPEQLIARHVDDVAALRARAHRCLVSQISHASAELGGLRGRAKTLSPGATLDRGYALVIGSDGHVVRTVQGLPKGGQFEVRLADGRVSAKALSTLVNPSEA